VGTAREKRAFAHPTAVSATASTRGAMLPEFDDAFRAANQRQDASPDNKMIGESRH
jgi:hypothetical protein